MSKKKVVYEFPKKCFKTTERHSLAVCVSLCGEKKVFVNNYYLLLVFLKKHLFKQIQIFIRNLPFLNMVRKKKLSEYFSAPF